MKTFFARTLLALAGACITYGWIGPVPVRKDRFEQDRTGSKDQSETTRR